jgi:hypothetical protein
MDQVDVEAALDIEDSTDPTRYAPVLQNGGAEGGVGRSHCGCDHCNDPQSCAPVEAGRDEEPAPIVSGRPMARSRTGKVVS